MSVLRKLRPGFWGGLIVLPLLVFCWYWFVERVEVPPGYYLVRIHLWGKDLPENEIVAPDESYKGVMLEVKTEGRIFLNPLFWKHEVHPLLNVPDGKCLVLTRKYGKEIPRERIAQGDFLARDGERGVVRDVKPPSSYRLNPYAYSWELKDAVEIKESQVGVRTLKVGRDPLDTDEKKPAVDGLYVVDEGYRGVQRKPAPSGKHYINPAVESILPIDVQEHKADLADIVFPSRDGFLLRPHVTVVYAVRPEKAPELFVRLSDYGHIHQEDRTEEQIKHNEILQKVILPYIRGYARLEGSNFNAKDFIVTDTDKQVDNARLKLEGALREKVQEPCRKLGIEIRSVTLSDLKPPDELKEQIAQRDQARREQEKNVGRLSQLKSEQDLKAKEALSQQEQESVTAETRLAQETTRAEQRKQVEESRLKQELASAQLRLDAARLQAEARLAKGKAEAGVIEVQNDAEVAGLRKAVQGFGSAQQFAQYHVLMRLAPAVAEIFASDDSELAKLLTSYLTPPASMSKPPANADKPMVPEGK